MRAMKRWPGGFGLRPLPAWTAGRGGLRQRPPGVRDDPGPWPPQTDAAADLPDGVRTLDFVLVCLAALLGLLLLSVPLWG